MKREPATEPELREAYRRARGLMSRGISFEAALASPDMSALLRALVFVHRRRKARAQPKPPRFVSRIERTAGTEQADLFHDQE